MGGLGPCGRSVYPACAGIDLETETIKTSPVGLPRMRGDRPWKALSGNAKHTFTPHARGSTFGKTLPESFSTVYPACAGIDLLTVRVRNIFVSLPRMRGDRPHTVGLNLWVSAFTPHARGSTPTLAVERQLLRGLPRMRGDRPCCKYSLYVLFRFTPHARGSTGCRMCYDLHAVVYPACAGIDPACSGLKNREPGLPRMRGDRPAVNPLTRVTKGFTPHARGSTPSRRSLATSARVYPACAGIDLGAVLRPVVTLCLPRMRGDRP